MQGIRIHITMYQKEVQFFTTSMTCKKRAKELHCDNTSPLYDGDRIIKSVPHESGFFPSCDFVYFTNKGKIVCIEAKGMGDRVDR